MGQEIHVTFRSNLANGKVGLNEIAQMRGVSVATINRHREHIRRKLKITNSDTNLMTYLQSGFWTKDKED